MGSINNVAIIGAGAMGAFYASKFYQMQRDIVSLIARGDRYNKLKKMAYLMSDN